LTPSAPLMEVKGIEENVDETEGVALEGEEHGFG
jgi:hypothetical protein